MKKYEFIDRIIGLAIVGMFIGLVIWFGIITESYAMLTAFLVLALAVTSMARFTYEGTYESQEDED